MLGVAMLADCAVDCLGRYELNGAAWRRKRGGLPAYFERREPWEAGEGLDGAAGGSVPAFPQTIRLACLILSPQECRPSDDTPREFFQHLGSLTSGYYRHRLLYSSATGRSPARRSRVAIGSNGRQPQVEARAIPPRRQIMLPFHRW